MRIAIQEGTTESKNMGNASRQQAFEIKRVHKSKCQCLMTEMTFLAYTFSF